jgi:hypothetical protein
MVAQFGDCYIAPKNRMHKEKYIKTVPLRIESVHPEPLLLTLRSNLANQILIFSDEELSCPAENLSLPGEGCVTVYVCMLVPVAGKKDVKFNNVGFGSVTLWDEYNKGVSRELVVGITVEVIDPVTKESIVQKGLQMKGRIGKSVLRLNTSFIDLGCCKTVGHTITSSFVISNHSDLLPLRFAVMPPQGVTVSVSGGELEGRKKSEGSSSITVDVTFRCNDYGLYLQPIVVSNLSAYQYWSAYEEKYEIFLQHFADQGCVQSEPDACDDAGQGVEQVERGGGMCTGVHLEKNYALPQFIDQVVVAYTPATPLSGMDDVTRCTTPILTGAPPTPVVAVVTQRRGAESRPLSPSASILVPTTRAGNIGDLAAQLSVVPLTAEQAAAAQSAATQIPKSPVHSSKSPVAASKLMADGRLRIDTEDTSEGFRQLQWLSEISPATMGSGSGRDVLSSPAEPAPAASAGVGGASARPDRPDLTIHIQNSTKNPPVSPSAMEADAVTASAAEAWDSALTHAVRMQASGLTVRRVVLRNTTHAPVLLRPLSTCGLYVNVGGMPDVEDALKRALSRCRTDTERVVSIKKQKIKACLSPQPVGQVFELASQACVTLHIVRVPTEELSDETREQLDKGFKVAFEGALLLESEKRSATGAALPFIAHRILVDGWWCQSLSQAQDTVVDLGKLGHVNQWQPVEFCLRLSNLSEIPLSLTAEIRPLSGLASVHQVVLCGDKGEEYVLGADQAAPEFNLGAATQGTPQQGTVKGWLRPMRIESDGDASKHPGSGVCSWTLHLHNVHNPANVLTYTLNAHIVTGALLRISGRQVSGPRSGPLTLQVPDLVLPSVPEGSGCNEWFHVTNISDEVIELSVEVVLDSEVSSVLTLDVLSSSTSTHVTSFSLDPSETLQLVVVLKALHNVHLLPEALCKKRVAVGCIRFKSPSLPTEEVSVVGAFSQGRTLTPSAESLSLSLSQGVRSNWSSARGFTRSALEQATSFEVSSNCGIPIKFDLRLQLPPELDPGCVHVDPVEDTLSPYGSCKVRLSPQGCEDALQRVPFCAHETHSAHLSACVCSTATYRQKLYYA